MKKLAAGAVALALTALVVVPTAAWAGDHGGGHGGGHDGGGMGDHGSGGGMGDHGSGGGMKDHPTATTVPGAREIAVTARSFKFSPKRITVAAGEDVTIALRSTDVLHDFVVKDAGHIVAAKAGKTKRGGLRIDEPGTYRFWCSISGHRAAGMQGTIVVE